MASEQPRDINRPHRIRNAFQPARYRVESILDNSRPSRQRGVIAALTLLLAGGSWITPPTLLAQLPEDPPRIVRAGEGLSEQQQDHVDAVALFAHGRVLLQRALQSEGVAQQETLESALRQFERAWWFEHDFVSILEDIVPLAFQLERKLEATRYLILAAEQQELPVELLRQVAAQLANMDAFDTQQAQRALKLYQKVEQLEGDAVSVITQFEIGRLALTTGQYTLAADALAAVQEALETPGNASLPSAVRDQLLQRPEVTYALLGECYLRAKRLDAAEAAFRSADKAKPQTAVLGFRLALVEHDRGHAEAALRHLDEYFSAKTTAAGLAPYLLLRELIDPAAGDRELPDSDGEPGEQTTAAIPSEALLAKLRELAQADPNNPLLGYYLADALRQSEQWDEATTLYKKLLELKPAADGYQGLVDIYLSQKQFAPLLTLLGEVVWKTGSLEPLGTSVPGMARDPLVLQPLTQLARDLTSHPEESPPQGILLAIALLQAQAKQVDLAVEFLEKGLAQPGPTAGQCATNVAFELLQADHPRRAAELFQRILDEKLLPDQMAEVNFYLSGAWTLAKDYDLALAAARQAGRLEPNSPRLVAREPWVLFQAKRLDDAEAGYREVLDRFDSDFASPENRDAMRDIRMILSAISVERQDLAAAEELLQQVLDEFPEDIGAFNDLGYLWCDQGKRLQRSLRMVQRAVEAEPENLAYRDSLGWALFRLERYAEAVEELEKAAAGDKVDGVILEHLGDAYAKLDQPAKARQAWQDAATAFKNQGNSERQQAMEAKLKDISPE